MARSSVGLQGATLPGRQLSPRWLRSLPPSGGYRFAQEEMGPWPQVACRGLETCHRAERSARRSPCQPAALGAPGPRATSCLPPPPAGRGWAPIPPLSTAAPPRGRLCLCLSCTFLSTSLSPPPTLPRALAPSSVTALTSVLLVVPEFSTFLSVLHPRRRERLLVGGAVQSRRGERKVVRPITNERREGPRTTDAFGS